MAQKRKSKPTVLRSDPGEAKARAEEHAARAHQAHEASTKWEDRQLEYYRAFKKWAAATERDAIPEAVDAQINGTFFNIRHFELTDPAKADDERVKLYGLLTNLWIDATPSLTPGLRKQARLNLATVSTFEKAQEMEGNLLGVHMLTSPAIDKSIRGAEHYGYFAGIVADKCRNRDYGSDPQAWWLVHDVLYNSWLSRSRIGKDEDVSPPPPMAPRRRPKAGPKKKAQKKKGAAEPEQSETERKFGPPPPPPL